MRKLFMTMAALACGAMISLPAVAQEVTLRIQHFISPRGAIPAFFITPWADKIMEESNGRIKIEIYPAMQLGGSPPSLFDQVKDGVIDGTWTIPSYTPGRFPGAEVFELPFIGTKSAENTSKALWEFYEKYLQDEFQEVKIVAIHVHGEGLIHTREKSVSKLEDMQGLKLRTPTRIASKMLEAAGATPVGIPVPAFPEALSKGVVDGGVIPYEIVPSLKIHELASSHTGMGGDQPFYNTVFVFAMNKDKYESLPDDLKAIIDANSGMMASAWAGQAMDKGDGPGKEVIEQQGNPIIALSDEETERWKQLSEPIIQEWIEEMSAKGLPAAQMVEDARALVAKHSGG